MRKQIHVFVLIALMVLLTGCTVQASPTQHKTTIEGPAEFVLAVNDALDLLKDNSEYYYSYVSRYVLRVRVGELSNKAAFGNAGVFGTVTIKEPVTDVYYLAETLVHEAKHMELYDEWFERFTYTKNTLTSEKTQEIQKNYEYRATLEGYRARLAVKDPAFIKMTEAELQDKLNAVMKTQWWKQ